MGILCAILAGLLFLPVILWILSPGKPRPFLDANKKEIAGSIAEKIFVEINGVRQGMFIRGKSQNNPVVLFVHGGPGMPEYFLAEKYMTKFEEALTVCYWEQRGSGLSYLSDGACENVTAEQLVADAIAVTDCLRKRFGQEKIYLMAHSWGTFVGIQAAARHPELYYAYIGMAQVSKQQESERMAYEYMLSEYKASGNRSKLKKMEDYSAYLANLSLRDETIQERGDPMKLAKPGFCKFNKSCYVLFAFFTLLIVQELAGKAGGAIADAFTYERIDPANVFVWQSVHHTVVLLIGLAVVALLSRRLKDNFGVQLGDRRKGMRYFAVFTAALTFVSLIYHLLTRAGGRPVTVDFALNLRNVLGTLGFQLFLSGTTEEILYRALPVTVLVHILGKSVMLKGHITLEVILASLLFSIAHIQWSLFPFAVDADYSQLFYAFAIGTVQGVAYQESRSVLYPMLMHSVSNVLMVGTGYLFAALA